MEITTGLRPQLAYFATVMEFRLKQNDYKGGWDDAHLSWLLMRLRQEVEELQYAIDNWTRNDIIGEASDVANFAMMIADIAKNASKID